MFFCLNVEMTPRIMPNDHASTPRCSSLICARGGCFAARMQARCTKSRLESAVSHNTYGNCEVHLTTSTKQDSFRATTSLLYIIHFVYHNQHQHNFHSLPPAAIPATSTRAPFKLTGSPVLCESSSLLAIEGQHRAQTPRRSRILSA